MNQMQRNNMAFLLFVDTVRWYTLEASSQMTYSYEIKLWWWSIWKLFGGQAIRYMRGPKHEGQLLAFENGESSSLCLVESKINFVIPSDKILQDFKAVIQIPIRLEPGIFYMMIVLLVKYRRPNSTQVLTTDGKKLTPGLFDHGGDMDCLGFEPEPVKVRRETFDKRKENLLNVVHELKQNKDNILVNINKHMFDKWIHSVTDIVTITCKELHSLSAKKKLDLERNKKKEQKYGGFQYIIDAINFTF